MSAGDSEFPHDFFLFTVVCDLWCIFSEFVYVLTTPQADNDFLTTDGISVGQPYNAGIDVDTQFMVWRVTLPTK